MIKITKYYRLYLMSQYLNKREIFVKEKMNRARSDYKNTFHNNIQFEVGTSKEKWRETKYVFVLVD